MSAGKDPTIKPVFLVRNTQITGDPVRRGTVKIGVEVTLTLVDCTFSNVVFDVDAGAVVRVSGGTADGRSLFDVLPNAVPISSEPEPRRIESVRISGAGLRFEFVSAAFTPYAVEYCKLLGSGAWVPLTNVPALPVTRRVVVTDPITGSAVPRFYRLAIPAQP